MDFKPLKICILNSNFPPNKGGIATFGGNLVEHLARHSEVEKIAVVAFNNNTPRHEEIGKVEVTAYGKTSLLGMFFKVLKHVWQYRDHDIFHATTLFPVGGLVLLFAKFILGKKVFITIYGTDILTREGSAKTRWAKGFIMRHATRVLAFSKSTASLAQSLHHVPARQFAVVYPGIDREPEGKACDIRQQYNIAVNDFLVLTVCRLVARKGVDDIISALSFIPDDKVKLLVAGGGEEEQNLRQQALRLGLQDRIIFAGAITHEQIGDFYRAANVFVMASKYLKDKGDIEGLGIVFLEAQFYGLPVIGTASGGIPEAIEEGETGFVVKEGDMEALKEKILVLKDQPKQAGRMSRRAPRFVAESFSWERSVERHLAEYGG